MQIRWLFVRLPIDPDLPERDAPVPLARPVAVALVGIGGALGCLGRAWIGTEVPHATSGWPWSTVLVNIIGSGLLAAVLVTLLERYPFARTPRPLIGTGIIGGFTTYSTFAVDVVELSTHGRPLLGACYIAVTLVGSGSAALLGLLGGRAVDRIVDRGRWERRVRHAGLDRSETNSP